MRGYKLDDNKAVNDLIGMEITGNVIPLEWYKHIKRSSGKPYDIAIMILADIVYWYRPIKIRDEATGSVVGYKKKFKADLLQKSYKSFADLYGYTKDQARDAVKHLEDMGVIYTEFRHPVINGVKFGNLLFIGLDVDRLKEITYTLSDLNPIGVSDLNLIPMGKESDTNTEINPEITLTDSNNNGKSPGDYTEQDVLLKYQEVSGQLITPFIASQLADEIRDWDTKKHINNPVVYPGAYAVYEAIVSMGENAAAPSYNYLKTILDDWAMRGFKAPKPGTKKRAGSKKGSKRDKNMETLKEIRNG